MNSFDGRRSRWFSFRIYFLSWPFVKTPSVDHCDQNNVLETRGWKKGPRVVPFFVSTQFNKEKKRSQSGACCKVIIHLSKLFRANFALKSSLSLSHVTFKNRTHLNENGILFSIYMGVGPSVSEDRFWISAEEATLVLTQTFCLRGLLLLKGNLVSQPSNFDIPTAPTSGWRATPVHPFIPLSIRSSCWMIISF